MKKQNNTKVQRGFTLMELMVVIAIIGILASIVFPGLTDSRKKARDSERISEIGELSIGYELFYSSCKRYPVNGLSSADNGGGACPAGITLGDYIDATNMLDPLNAAPNVYTYAANGTGSSYRIQAVLEIPGSALDNYSDAAGWGGPACADGASQYCKGR